MLISILFSLYLSAVQVLGKTNQATKKRIELECFQTCFMSLKLMVQIQIQSPNQLFKQTKPDHKKREKHSSTDS